jgi:hypothetical protein
MRASPTPVRPAPIPCGTSGNAGVADDASAEDTRCRGAAQLWSVAIQGGVLRWILMRPGRAGSVAVWPFAQRPDKPLPRLRM